MANQRAGVRYNQNRFLANEGTVYSNADYGDWRTRRVDADVSADRAAARVIGEASPRLEPDHVPIHPMAQADAVDRLRDVTRVCYRPGDMRIYELGGDLLASIRALGVGYNTARAYQIPVVDLRKEDFHAEGSSTGSYYRELVELGMHKFPHQVPIFSANAIRMTIECPVIGGVGGRGQDHSASGAVDATVTSTIFTTSAVNRRSVELDDSEVGMASFSKTWMDARAAQHQSKDQVARIMCLDKTQTINLDDGTLMRLMARATGSCRITRYVKLWLLWLTCSEGGECTVSIPNYTSMDYTSVNVSTVAVDLEHGKGNVVYIESRSRTELALAGLCTKQFPPDTLRTHDGRVPYLGGYSIPTELDGPTYVIGKDNPAPKPNDTFVFNRYNVYSTIVKYAKSTGSHDDAAVALSLASIIFVGDGLMNVSLPKVQGLLDLFAQCVVSKGMDMLPPAQLNSHLLPGAFVLVTQMRMMVKDALALMESGPSRVASLAQVGNKETRCLYYNAFQEWWFSRAMALACRIDPLRVMRDVDLTEIHNTNYSSLAWAKTSNKKMVAHTFQAYANSGKWLPLDKVKVGSEDTILKVSATWNVLDVLTTEDRSLPEVRVIRTRGVVNNPVYKSLTTQLAEGTVCLLPGEPVIIPKLLKTKEPDSSWIDVPLPTNPKPPKVQFIDEGDDDEGDDDEEVLIVGDNSGEQGPGPVATLETDMGNDDTTSRTSEESANREEDERTETAIMLLKEVMSNHPSAKMPWPQAGATPKKLRKDLNSALNAPDPAKKVSEVLRTARGHGRGTGSVECRMSRALLNEELPTNRLDEWRAVLCELFQARASRDIVTGTLGMPFRTRELQAFAWISSEYKYVPSVLHVGAIGLRTTTTEDLLTRLECLVTLQNEYYTPITITYGMNSKVLLSEVVAKLTTKDIPELVKQPYVLQPAREYERLLHLLKVCAGYGGMSPRLHGAGKKMFLAMFDASASLLKVHVPPSGKERKEALKAFATAAKHVGEGLVPLFN